MFDLGTQELIVIFLVAFLVFGPKKLPELGRTLGRGIREIKAAMRGVRETFEEAEEEVTEGLNEVKKDLEESVSSSLEHHVSSEEGERPKEETREGEDTVSPGEGKGGKKEETDKDG